MSFLCLEITFLSITKNPVVWLHHSECIHVSILLHHQIFLVKPGVQINRGSLHSNTSKSHLIREQRVEGPIITDEQTKNFRDIHPFPG